MPQQSPSTPARQPAIRGRWGWLILAVMTALAGFAHADPDPNPPYTIDVIMLPCENRLHSFPKISSNIASHAGDFNFRVVSAADRETEGGPWRTFEKYEASRDEFRDSSRFLDVTWSSFTEPYLQAFDPQLGRSRLVSHP